MELERRAQTVSNQPALNPELSGWLEDQKLFLCENQAEPDTADHHDECSEQQLGFTSALYQACLSLYREVYKQCRLVSRCPQESQTHISQHLGPFISFSEVLEHRKIDLCGQSTGSQRSYREVALPCRENTCKGYEPTNLIFSPCSWLMHR
jgi:hypothetical protein